MNLNLPFATQSTITPSIPPLPIGFPNLDEFIHVFIKKVNRVRSHNLSTLNPEEVNVEWAECLSYVEKWIAENKTYGSYAANNNTATFKQAMETLYNFALNVKEAQERKNAKMLKDTSEFFPIEGNSSRKTPIPEFVLRETVVTPFRPEMQQVLIEIPQCKNKCGVLPSQCANEVAYAASPSTSQQFVTKEDFEAYKQINNQQLSLILKMLSTLKP